MFIIGLCAIAAVKVDPELDEEAKSYVSIAQNQQKPIVYGNYVPASNNIHSAYINPGYSRVNYLTYGGSRTPDYDFAEGGPVEAEVDDLGVREDYDDAASAVPYSAPARYEQRDDLGYYGYHHKKGKKEVHYHQHKHLHEHDHKQEHVHKHKATHEHDEHHHHKHENEHKHKHGHKHGHKHENHHKHDHHHGHHHEHKSKYKLLTPNHILTSIFRFRPTSS